MIAIAACAAMAIVFLEVTEAIDTIAAIEAIVHQSSPTSMMPFITA